MKSKRSFFIYAEKYFFTYTSRKEDKSNNQNQKEKEYLLMSEKKKKQDETTAPKSVPFEVKVAGCNITEYTKEDLVKMVNSTKGDDFKVLYPTATFDRKLAMEYLEKKHDMDYIGHGVMVPHGISMDDLLDAYEKQKSVRDDTEKKQDGCQEVDEVVVAMFEKKERATLSMNAGTMKRWKDFVAESKNASNLLSAACDLFIKKYRAGQVRLEAEWEEVK